MIPSRTILRIAGPLCLALGATVASAQAATLPLVIEDLEAAPAGEIQLILRAGAPIPLGSGSLVVEIFEHGGPAAAPFASVGSATAFASTGAASATATLASGGQRLEIAFTGDAGGVLNESAGPLVAIRLTLAAGLAEDDRFDLKLDKSSLALEAPTGEAIPAVLTERGRLRLRTPRAGEGELSAEGAEVPPGSLALFGAATAQPFAIGSGTVEVLYDPAIADGAPTISIDPRYGAATIDAVAEPVPGDLLVTFHSTGGTLNADLYGLFLTVALPLRADLPLGTVSPVALGPATALADPAGAPIAIEPGVDEIKIVPAELLFEDEFEDEDLFEWD